MSKQSVVASDVYEPLNGVHAVRVGNMVYTAAALPLGRNGDIVGKGDIVRQSEQVYGNLGAILRSSGAQWSEVFKANVYVNRIVEDPLQLRAARSVRQRYLAPGQQVGSAASMDMADADVLVAVELFAQIGGSKQLITAVPGIVTAPGWALAVRIGDRLFVGGQQAIDARKIGPEIDVDKTSIVVEGDLAAQTERVYSHLDAILKRAGIGWDDVVKVRQYITKPRIGLGEFRGARNKYVSLGKFMSTSVGCHDSHPNWRTSAWLIEVELEASAAEKEYIDVPGIPHNPDGPQPHAIKAGKAVHVHGMLSWDTSLHTIYQDDIVAQAEQTYRHLDGILKGAGLGWRDVVHVRSFCPERKHFPAVREVQSKWMQGVSWANTELVGSIYDPDARALLEVDIMVVSP